MILISFLLVAVAIVALAVGSWIVHDLWLIYVSIGISIVAAVFLAVGTFRGRDEIFGRGTAEGPRKGARPAGGAAKAKSAKASKAAAARPTRTGPGGRTARDVDERSGGGARGKRAATSTAAAPEVAADVTVVVVPGRKRYHLPNCRQLVGRAREELTYEEARDEGFAPCMACMPDAALAARATASETAASESSAEEASQDTGKPDTEDTGVADHDEASDGKDSEHDIGETGAPTEEFAALSGSAQDGEAGDRREDQD